MREKLQPAIDDLSPFTDVLRPNAVDRIHLTLHFLGNVPPADVDALANRLASSTRELPRFDVSAEGVGAFPSFSRPQVLWAGITGDALPNLIALQTTTGSELKGLGIAVEDRQFHPHLTVARVRRPIRGPARKPFRDWQERWRGAHFGTIPVDRTTLFRSELGGGPPRYSVIAKFELQ